MEVSVAELLFVVATDFGQDEVAIKNFAEFLLVSADDNNRRKDFFVESVVSVVFELIIAHKLVLIEFFSIGQQFPALSVVLNYQQQINGITVQNLWHWGINLRNLQVILLDCISSLRNLRPNTVQFLQVRNLLF